MRLFRSRVCAPVSPTAVLALRPRRAVRGLQLLPCLQTGGGGGGLGHRPRAAPPQPVSSLWKLPPHLPAWLWDCPDRFAGFLFTGSWFSVHTGGFLPLYFFSDSLSFLSSLPGPDNPQAKGSGLLPSRPLPCPKLGAPLLPGPPARPASLFFNGYENIDNYTNRNANNNKSHLLSTYQT